MDIKGPAYRSGRVRRNDRLVSIDGEEVQGQVRDKSGTRIPQIAS